MSRKKINECGDTFWYNEQDQFHREDGPAMEWASGDKSWWLNGKLHREDGPAIEWADGNKVWYLNGMKYSESKYKTKLKSLKCERKLKR